jgi:hypothetical protein
MTDTLKLPPNPVMVYEYKDRITHSMQRTEHLDRAREAVNKHLVGTNAINVEGADGLVPNPEVEKHPNRKFLDDVHWLLNATNEVAVTVKVYSDGSRKLFPCDDTED